eukprot:TRINITY_DN410_c0_g2_i2.p1 TRINITY_DN410_c0_g2~~TRINITY_DN410_c0_g2_i2.p1  ORF type:complete len:196 (+),score=32.15 TRINITY_DN410_c0_g2_i2:297-884(+)
MFNNTEDMVTPEFGVFLRVLGDTVDLEGWPKYSGGLDPIPGAKSVYTDWQGFEIMFHVSTMLPFVKGAESQLERKRHICNDVVVIVFQEGDTPFDPACIKNSINHVYILVHPEKHPKLGFKVSAVVSQDTKLCPPVLPRGHVFEPGPYLRNWLMSKLVQAELTALSESLKLPASMNLWAKRKELLFNVASNFNAS